VKDLLPPRRTVCGVLVPPIPAEGVNVYMAGAADAEMLALLLLSSPSVIALLRSTTIMNVCDAVSEGHVVSQYHMSDVPLASLSVSVPSTVDTPSK